MELCSEGTLAMRSPDGWPIATSVQFSLDANGKPLFCLQQAALRLVADNRVSLNAKLVQSGRRAQCTLKGRIVKADIEPQLPEQTELFTMNVDQVLHLHHVGQEEVWFSGEDYTGPLNDDPSQIVEIVERVNGQWGFQKDIHRLLCKANANLGAQVEEASIMWMDRCGFDVRVFTTSQRIEDIRIPFEREAQDYKDGHSMLTRMLAAE